MHGRFLDAGMRMKDVVGAGGFGHQGHLCERAVAAETCRNHTALQFTGYTGQSQVALQSRAGFPDGSWAAFTEDMLFFMLRMPAPNMKSPSMLVVLESRFHSMAMGSMATWLLSIKDFPVPPRREATVWNRPGFASCNSTSSPTGRGNRPGSRRCCLLQS